jgi:hypothetical protein
MADGKPLAAIAADNGFHQDCMECSCDTPRKRLAMPVGFTSVALDAGRNCERDRHRGIRSAVLVAWPR